MIFYLETNLENYLETNLEKKLFQDCDLEIRGRFKTVLKFTRALVIYKRSCKFSRLDAQGMSGAASRR